MKTLTCVIAAILAIGSALAATDPWDLPPLNYSDTPATDSIARLAKELKDGGTTSIGATPLDQVRHLLALLHIPQESQILVFSKTSKQNNLIHPGNPRSIYFNENSYLAYVPGGDIEVITQDPALGPVYYAVDLSGERPTPTISRDTSQCLSCHGTGRTESVPGVLVRSVFPDEDGHPLLSLGTFLTDTASPIRERWGGYYVTGRSSLPHMGNRTYQKSSERSFPKTSPELKSLGETIDTTRYLRATSDIVALMVLEHQCRLQNEFTSAAMNYKRIHWLQKSLDPSADPDQGTAGRHADESASRIVRLMLFENETSLGENGIDGDPAFQDAFTRRFPKTKSGRSLADFQLNRRIFKYRCSYMIYSAAFKSLPVRVKSAVLTQLRQVLESDPAPENFPDIKSSERRKIATILSETLPAWNAR